MEAKLNEAINSQDWYSAHQLLISLAQRHQRARRYAESCRLLSGGLVSMCPDEKTWPPLATVVDVAEKYVEVFMDGNDHKDDADNEALAVLKVVLKAGSMTVDEDEKHAVAWISLSSRLISVCPSLCDPFFSVLISTDCPLSWKLGWCVQHMAQRKEVWEQVIGSASMDGHAVTVAVIQLLAVKAFGSASALLKSVLTKLKESGDVNFTYIDDTTGSLPSFLSFIGSQDNGLNCLNAAQMLFMVCQRRSPAKGLFTQIRDKFKFDEELSSLIDVLVRVYSPQPKANPNNMNPLASMFQNMFMAPSPSQAPTKRGTAKKSLDLD